MPQPPATGGGGKKKAGLIIGAVAVVAAIGVGVYFVIGGGGGAGGLEDDGAHKLTTPATVLTDYKRASDEAAETDSDTVKDLEKSGVKDGTSVTGFYTTADLTGYDPSDPSTAPDPSEMATAKGITYLGAYGKISDPEAVLDKFFAEFKKESEKNSSSSSETGGGGKAVGEPESVDIDGAVMKCQGVEGTNPVSKKEKTDWICAWADYSTIALVSPGDATKGVPKDVAVDITTKLRKEIRVKA